MVSNENRKIVYEENRGNDETGQTLRIIAFNDVYNIDEVKKGKGGAARFYTAMEHIKSERDSLVLFAGDAVSPSSLSIFAKGNQMIDVLNEFKIDAAAIGNHEFDMGMETLEGLIKRSNFPWLFSNVLDPDTLEPLIGTKIKHVVQMNGLKIGVISLAEKEWCRSLCCVNFDDLKYENYIEASKRLADELRTKDNVDIVIALTHMRWNNDEKLAKACPEIDLIIGGHDHEYGVQKVNERLIVKSGNDFCEFSVVELAINKNETEPTNKCYVKQIEKITVDSSIEENAKIKEIVIKYLDEVNSKLDKEIGLLNCDLDGRIETVRKKESNLGNFLCDIIMSAVAADCCILNGGSMRSNRIHKAGSFTIRDIRDILSFESELVVSTVTGAQLHALLENCVRNFGSEGGRFPQVSNIYFAFDPKKPPGQRINSHLIQVNNDILDLNKEYDVCTNSFLKSVDEVLKACPVKISSESIPFLYNLVENYFQAVNDKKNNVPDKKHKIPIISRSVEAALINELAEKVLKNEKKRLKRTISVENASLIITKALKSRECARRKILFYKERKLIRDSPLFKERMQELESKSLMWKPRVEGRSIIINDQETLDALIAYYERKVKKKQLSAKLSINSSI